MICSACGFNNEDNAKYCQRCGNSLNYYSRGANTYSKSNNYQQSRNNSNTIIIAVTLIIIALIVAGTFLLISDNIPFSNNNSQNNQTNQVTYNQLKVKENFEKVFFVKKLIKMGQKSHKNFKIAENISDFKF